MNTVAKIFFAPSFLLATFLCQAAPAVPTDSGRLLQDNKPTLPKPSPTPPAIQTPQPAKLPASEATADVKVRVNEFSFSGNTVISSDKLNATVAEWLGRDVNFGELIQITDQVEALYHEAGYFLAQATLPPQKIRLGVISIVITEGKLGQTRLEGESRNSPKIAYRYLDRLAKGGVLTESLLDRQILLINDLPGGSASLDLQAGSAPGTTDVVLMQKADALFTGRVNVDNYGLPTTGEYRLGVNTTLNSPLHLGDRLLANIIASNTGNLHTYNLRYELPIGGNGWRLHAEKSRATYNLGGDFSALNASGTADLWRFGVNYPWLRSRKTNINLQLEADHSNLEDSIPPLNLKKQSYGISFSPSANWQDNWLGGAANQAGLSLRHGQLNLGSEAKLQDLANTEGSFNKLTIDLQRHQTVSSSLSLNLQWQQQFASTNLDSSEKISIGGAQNLVAYPIGQATADEGGFGKLELRWQPRDDLSLGTFAEYAYLRLQHDANAGVSSNHANFRDIGFSANWAVFKHIDFSVSVAWAGNQPPNVNDNDRPRIWANLGYFW
jgi:hemolysin activation/secretion protein